MNIVGGQPGIMQLRQYFIIWMILMIMAKYCAVILRKNHLEGLNKCYYQCSYLRGINEET